MDERSALAVLADKLDYAGDDAAIVGDTVISTDMLHERTDFPKGTTRYTAGWRAVGASLSDIAAMGAEATAAVAVYAAPTFEETEIVDFVDGACDVCGATDAAYVGGDLDNHSELTVTTTAIGQTDDPVRRSGAQRGDILCVTGTLGRSAAALRLFDEGEIERANNLFRFQPRVATGQVLADHATAMMDSSDGLARSLHQLAEASDCGFEVSSPLPIDDSLLDVEADAETARTRATTFGEDFELVCTMPASALETVQARAPTTITKIGRVVESGITLDGEPLADEGYTHGRN